VAGQQVAALAPGTEREVARMLIGVQLIAVAPISSTIILTQLGPSRNGQPGLRGHKLVDQLFVLEVVNNTVVHHSDARDRG